MSLPARVRHQLHTQVDELIAAAAGYAAEADRERRLSPPVTEAVVEAGFARHFVPERWGGASGTCTDLTEAVSMVAEACTSAAWCASVVAGASRMGTYLPLDGQGELWEQGPDTVVAGALIPRGTARRTNEGWRLSGSWGFTSAVDFSDWSLVCARVLEDAEAPLWFFALPRSDYTVLNTWDSVGMRGTGSNTLVAENVRVPAHRGFPRDDMLHGRSRESTARCHTVPLRAISGPLFAAPALGAARAAFALWITRANAGIEETDTATPLTTARLATTIDAAALLLDRAALSADTEASSTDPSLRNPVDCALAVRRLVDVVEQIYRGVGSAEQSPSLPLQRVWRDIHGLASHVALRFEDLGIDYGRYLIAESTRS
ncbi:acyl-CoA dehydrogenase family protein [Nocardiopsis sp. ATB16-24]|uniref:acyl-CoA dehydrogenase family protein n=1 Tax=Nocardiopsis sp. ATB16-24 TaxID=3019555 RepID=UPI0025562004|nr:acyl-CoA dehydrogenase family protein [Nocardiopsis sp. ATB16-24]